MKIVATGDWHLDRVTAGVERFDEICQSIEEVLAYVEGQRPDLFVFLGDLCNPDTARAWAASAASIRVAKFIAERNVPQMWLVGNHDVADDGRGSSTLSPLAEAATNLAGCIVAEVPQLVGYFDVGVLALPYVSRARLYDPVDVVAKLEVRHARHVVLSHPCLEAARQGSESAEMARGREMYLPAEKLKQRLPGLVALNGHYHERQEVNEHGLMVHCAGSLARLDRGERGHVPAFLVVEV